MNDDEPLPLAARPSWRAAFTHRPFGLFEGARLLAEIAGQMQGVAIGWQIYAVTRRPLDLAWVGLAQFVPAACLSLVAGHAADRFDRRRILLACHGALALLSLALAALAGHRGGVGPIYAVLAGVGVARAFLGPAAQSIVPSLVPAEHLANALVWSSALGQAAVVLGPMLGGVAYALFGGPGAVYGAAACGSLGALVLVASMRPVARAERAEAASGRSVLAGVRYVWSNPIVLGAISLDLFAVLFGGATALLPVYARDVLHLGPWALGALRSAPAVGAAVTGLALARWPVERRAGVKMLGCVAIYGLATLVFGMSRSFLLSLAALAVLGASDMVSVVVRSTLVQLATPDAMRGRVGAVNLVFIGASSELGELESGLTAQWLGAVPAVVLGGVGTLIVVAVWAALFPRLRRVDALDDAGARAA